jgi:hypothetical protein
MYPLGYGVNFKYLKMKYKKRPLKVKRNFSGPLLIKKSYEFRPMDKSLDG